MNIRGGATLFALVTAMLIFMSGMLMVNFFKQDITDYRTSMGCSGTETSDGNRIACLGGDLTIPYFIVAILSTAGGVVLSRFNL